MLTDAKLKSLYSSPPAERIELNDGTISGLLLRVGPRGRPTWTLRYTVKGRGGVTERGKKLAGRKFYRITLGEYPAISLLKARAQAATMLADADNGINPIERLESAATVRRGTIAELSESFLEHHCRGRLQSAGKAEWIMRDYVNPRFGDYAPKQVTRRDVIALLDDLKKRATPTATMDTRKWLSVFFNWALEREHVDFNPVSGVRSPVKSKPRWGTAASTKPFTASIRPPAKLLMNGCARSPSACGEGGDVVSTEADMLGISPILCDRRGWDWQPVCHNRLPRESPVRDRNTRRRPPRRNGWSRPAPPRRRAPPSALPHPERAHAARHCGTPQTAARRSAAAGARKAAPWR